MNSGIRFLNNSHRAPELRGRAEGALNLTIPAIIIHFLMLLALLSGCSGEMGDIKNTIIKYNALLAEGYFNLNMTPLTAAATEEQVTRDYVYMSAFGEERIKMDARLKDINFLSVRRISTDTAEATTEETWDYTLINIDSGKPVSVNSTTYHLKYALTKKSGKWLVARIIIEKQSKDKN